VRSDYGSEIWSHRLHISKVKQKLNQVQGVAAKLMGRCYTSTSQDAAGVIAGLPPLDLKTAEIACRKALKKKETHPYLHLEIRREDFDSPRHLQQYLELVTLDFWQHRWEHSEKGRVTYEFFPVVSETPRKEFTGGSSHVLTGHGNFMCHLHRIGKSETDECRECGVRDDPIHRLQRWALFEDEREALCRFLGTREVCVTEVPNCPLEVIASFGRDTTHYGE
jgi:hypothetical protein